MKRALAKTLLNSCLPTPAFSLIPEQCNLLHARVGRQESSRLLFHAYFIPFYITFIAAFSSSLRSFIYVHPSASYSANDDDVAIAPNDIRR